MDKTEFEKYKNEIVKNFSIWTALDDEDWRKNHGEEGADVEVAMRVRCESWPGYGIGIAQAYYA